MAEGVGGFEISGKEVKIEKKTDKKVVDEEEQPDDFFSRRVLKATGLRSQKSPYKKVCLFARLGSPCLTKPAVA